MHLKTVKRIASAIVIATLSFSLIACGTSTASTTDEVTSETTTVESDTAATTLDLIDNSAWLYNEDDDVYYQIGIAYCATPVDEDYENLAIFVPGAYMTATDNGDGTYTCEINYDATVGENNYTAETAPIVIPVNTPGYAAQAALTEYTDVTEYTDQGFIYVHAGCRGRDAGAPAGVTDLKAAIRYVKYNSGNIAGSTDRIFSFGMSGGGAQSALLGITGDSDLYDDYLEQIGAVMSESDAIMGSMCWCPITSLDTADEAYEWNMGTTRSGLSDEEQAISDALTVAYADYINSIGLTDSEGNVLTLEESEDGRYQSGTYYEYIKGIIEESLNNFLADTEFPYDSDSSSQGHQAGMGPDGGGRGQGGPGGDFDGEMPDGDLPDGDFGGFGGDDSADGEGSENVDYTAIDDISRTEASSGITISGTFETVQDYIDALNANGTWVEYDEATNTATITSIADFAEAVKTASKSLGAFDQLDEGQGENTLFGDGDGEGDHFDSTLAEILEKLGSEYAEEYAADLERTDDLGHSVQERIDMYSPMYYLLESSEGYGTSTVAQYFRINTGLWQSDTSVTTESNLALALANYGSDVDYSFVWGQEHTTAEREGDSTTNFIAWVNECCAK